MLGDTLVYAPKRLCKEVPGAKPLEPGIVSHLPAPHFEFQPEASERSNERPGRHSPLRLWSTRTAVLLSQRLRSLTVLTGPPPTIS